MAPQRKTLTTEEPHGWKNFQENSPILRLLFRMCYGQKLTGIGRGRRQNGHGEDDVRVTLKYFVSSERLQGVLPVLETGGNERSILRGRLKLAFLVSTRTNMAHNRV